MASKTQCNYKTGEITPSQHQKKPHTKFDPCIVLLPVEPSHNKPKYPSQRPIPIKQEERSENDDNDAKNYQKPTRERVMNIRVTLQDNVPTYQFTEPLIMTDAFDDIPRRETRRHNLLVLQVVVGRKMPNCHKRTVAAQCINGQHNKKKWHVLSCVLHA